LKLSFVYERLKKLREKALWVPDTMLAPKALKDLDAWTTGVTKRAYERDLSKKSPDNYTMLDELVIQKKTYKVRSSAIWSSDTAYHTGNQRSAFLYNAWWKGRKY
jgi:hypothetical protein